MAKVKISYSLSNELREKLQQVADKKVRSVTPFCQKIVIEYLKKKGGK